ncbi:MAG: hypothetical protein KF912_06990 [Phycisphaeraceae bacterium]|nr:hypothetical protein [Phycisphaeraceae bacterium]
MMRSDERTGLVGGVVRAIGLIVGVSVVGGIVARSAEAQPQLVEGQVLVVYDSRLPDSLLVAEHYAGSAKVAGGVGGVAGSRPGVHVFDLATGGAAVTAPGTTTYPNFITRIRTPLRNHLEASGLTHEIRCIVTTKGLPHRVRDTDNANSGDSPTQTDNEHMNRDATNASMEAELALLWQDLTAGEMGGAADSFADGMIVNPYWGRSEPILAWPTTHITSPKAFVGAYVPGRFWWTTTADPAGRLSPGDIYLVCRLDGNTVDDVRALIDRSRHIVVDMRSVVVVLDESNSDGVQTPTPPPSSEFDNMHGIPEVNAGDDYELCRDTLLADGRILPANVRYDALADAANFMVGPRISYGGQGIVVTEPVLLLAHYGANHHGTKPGGNGANPLASSSYAESFHYSPGAIMNTMESFNARAFGGLTTSFNQEQIADFIAAGGTFGLGNVYEPFAYTVPDTIFVVRNFILGNLTWAEAAHTSIPFLSWAQIVIGDPLARIVRSTEDINGDGVVDVEDLWAWEQSPTDINNDGVANEADKRLLEGTVRAFERVDMTNRRR